MRNIKLVVKGMTCNACEDHVRHMLQKNGAENVRVNYQEGKAEFQLRDVYKEEDIRKELQKTRYQPREMFRISSDDEKDSTDETYDYDFLIIGSGGAAFSAAIQATENGLRVAMVEKGEVGGTCVNIGCVPSKTLLQAGHIQFQTEQHLFEGLNTSADQPDMKGLQNQKEQLVQQLRKEKYEDLIQEYGFDLIKGEAYFRDSHTVSVEGRDLTAKTFLIATGASPFIPDIPGLKGTNFLTSTLALELKEVPKHLVIIGSGYIALELGQMYRHLGAEVTLLQRSSNILKHYDPEISETVENMLKEEGITLIKDVVYKKVEENNGQKFVHIEVEGKPKYIQGDQLLVAAGRKPNTEKLHVENIGLELGEHGEVLTNDYLETNIPHIYAAGDVTLSPQFVYVAAHQGGIVGQNVSKQTKKTQKLAHIPTVTFTTPSIASIGWTEHQAKQAGYDVTTSVLPLESVPRAIVNHQKLGVFKLIMDKKNNQIMGAHVVAENAGDVIYAATLAVKFNLTADDLQETMAPYLTMAEGLKLASLTFDKDVSKLSCCAG
ncbi:mercury(II) reductase [Pontibacillus sp. HMF3514]|uniref:mercury(II) reductase n=1 Tax=Pontibacillus sp. HMF3514 TaxID=2692425 RepID=UPI00131FBA86|nr:mercury(II) reductase [Pontibacillus sp. HMF3514]QHE51549.1 mercury(II) reductase [Pontibacillus sp. HMF3514]